MSRYTYDECVWDIKHTHCQSNSSFTANQHKQTHNTICVKSVSESDFRKLKDWSFICDELCLFWRKINDCETWENTREQKTYEAQLVWCKYDLMVCNRNYSGLYSRDSNIPKIRTDTAKKHSTGKTMNLRSPTVRSPFTETYENIIITVWRNEINRYLYNYSISASMWDTSKYFSHSRLKRLLLIHV